MAIFASETFAIYLLFSIHFNKIMNIAIVGATGNVGRKILEVLEKKGLAIDNLYLLASSRSAGSKINFNKKPLRGKINIINVWEEPYETEFGKPTIKSGELSFKSLEAVTKALINNQVDVMVTAPINKNNIQSKDFNFPGHTDYLAKKLQGESLMFMLNENLRVGLLTDHIPIKEIEVPRVLQMKNK